MPYTFKTIFVPASFVPPKKGYKAYTAKIDGLNFSRTWCLYNIAKKTDSSEKLRSLADDHFNHSFSYISSGDYMGEHWLASFAVYAYFSR